jgi:hypothetical protein
MSFDFEIPSTTVPVGKGSIVVRGLNSEDVTALVTTYYGDIAAIIERYGEKAADGKVQSSTVVELALELAGQFPMLCAEIISRAAGSTEPADIDKVRLVSFPKQIVILREIAKLTMEDGLELKNWAEGLASLLDTGKLQLGPLATQLQTIIRTAENTSAS